MSDWLSIGGGALTARINPLGAELSSLTDAQGREWMTDADPAFWAGRSPLLFPIVGALNGGTYRHKGQEYALPQHGFARRRSFALIDSGADHATFQLTDDGDSRAVYPFAFALDAEYRIDGPSLTIACTVTNTGDEPMPASFGYHPAIAWPLPGNADKDGHDIAFDQPEPGLLARLSSGLIAGHDRPSPLIDGQILRLGDALFQDDALIWDGLASRAVTYRSPGGTTLRVEFPDADKLGIWSKPGARFVCIEPWWGIADPVGFAGEISEKPGIYLLAPGEERRFAIRISIVSTDRSS
ncbi:aldose 1-epimerase family protein [Sphingomonas sp. CJ99]